MTTGATAFDRLSLRRMLSATGLFGRIRAIPRRKWVILGLTLIINIGIVLMLIFESHYGFLKPQPFIAYFKSWEDGRSRADALEAQEEERRLQAEADRIAVNLDIAADKQPDPSSPQPATATPVPAAPE